MKKLIFIICSIFILSGCFNHNLPKCGDKEVKSLASDIFNSILKATGVVDNLEDHISIDIDIDKTKEISFNKEKEIRVCEAEFLFSGTNRRDMTHATQHVSIRYNIRWENKKKGIFYVEIVD